MVYTSEQIKKNIDTNNHFEKLVDFSGGDKKGFFF